MSLQELGLRHKARQAGQDAATRMVADAMAEFIREDPHGDYERSVPGLLQLAFEEFTGAFRREVARRELVPGCPLHDYCEHHLSDEECDYRSGRIDYQTAEQQAEEAFERKFSQRWDGVRAGND